jgi:hypothetical protein
MTPREPLTRYRPMRDPARGYHMWPAEDGDYVKFADVEARDQAFDNHGACRAQVEAWIERDQAREAEIRAKLESVLSSVREYIDWSGALHLGDCPEDDTCDCDGKPVNDGINGAVRTLESLLTPASQPKAPEHVCGLTGYSSMHGDTCPACIAENRYPASQEGTTR